MTTSIKAIKLQTVIDGMESYYWERRLAEILLPVAIRAKLSCNEFKILVENINDSHQDETSDHISTALETAGYGP